MHRQSVDTRPSPGPWDGITPPTRRGGSGRHVLDVLVELGFVSRMNAGLVIEQARNAGTAPEKLLVDQGGISQDQLARAVAERHGLDHVDLTQFPVDMAAAGLLGTTAAKRYEAIPIAYADERTLLVAMADPANVLAIDDIAIMTGLEIGRASCRERV